MPAAYDARRARWPLLHRASARPARCARAQSPLLGQVSPGCLRVQICALLARLSPLTVPPVVDQESVEAQITERLDGGEPARRCCRRCREKSTVPRCPPAPCSCRDVPPVQAYAVARLKANVRAWHSHGRRRCDQPARREVQQTGLKGPDQSNHPQVNGNENKQRGCDHSPCPGHSGAGKDLRSTGV